MSTQETVLMRERILETATRLFVAHGYDGISMREIAEACSLSKAGLYYHFKDKEDLFLAILNESLLELDAITQGARQQPGGARAKIDHFVRSIFTRLPVDQRAVIRLASSELSKITPEKRQVFSSDYGLKFVGPVRDILLEGMAQGELKKMDADLAVWGLLGLMYPFLNQGYHDLTAIDLVLTIFFEGTGND